MKTFILAVSIGLVIGVVEWVALDVITADLRGELSASSTYSLVQQENTAQSFYVGQNYALTTQHVQPAYNTLPRTVTTQELQ